MSTDDELKRMREAAHSAAYEQPEMASVSDVLAEIYADCDEAAAGLLQGHDITCKPKCTACCTLLTMIGPAEGIGVAVHLLRDPLALERILPRLRKQALALDVDGVNKAAWFSLQQKCALLGDDDLCTVYASRPACCRYHYVVTPAVNCSFGAANPETASPDLTPLEGAVWRFTRHYCETVGVDPDWTQAPIPVMVLAVLRSMARHDDAAVPPGLAVQIIMAASNVPEPDAWMRAHAVSLLTEPDGLLGADADAHRERIANMFSGDLVQIDKKK